jgi:hypothetical protein
MRVLVERNEGRARSRSQAAQTSGDRAVGDGYGSKRLAQHIDTNARQLEGHPFRLYVPGLVQPEAQ